MPYCISKKEPYFVQKNDDGVTRTLSLSVRRTRAVRQWRRLRMTSEWSGCTLMEPAGAKSGHERAIIQRKRAMIDIEAAKREKSVKRERDDAVPDAIVDAYRSRLSRGGET